MTQIEPKKVPLRRLTEEELKVVAGGDGPVCGCEPPLPPD